MSQDKKRQKLEKGLPLCLDEISQIIEFLTPKEIINFALTNKNIYHTIEKIAKTKSPEVLYDPWCIVQALSVKNFEFRSSKDLFLLQKKKKIIESLLITGSKNIEDILEEYKEVLSNTLEDYKVLEDFNQVKDLGKTPKVLGSVVKKLSIFDTISWEMIFDVLSHFPNLEEVKIDFYPSSKKYDLKNQHRILENVKKFEFTTNEGLPSQDFYENLLKLFPNVEHLKYVSDGDDSAESACRLILNNKKVKSLCIASNDGATPVCTDLSDLLASQLINELPNLESITLDHSSCISGEMFSLLNENSKLKYLTVIRIAYEGDLVDQHENIEFKNYFHKLKYLKLDGFEDIKMWDSIAKFCPNLETIQSDSSLKDYNEAICNHVLSNKWPNLKNLFLNWDNNHLKKLSHLNLKIQLRMED